MGGGTDVDAAFKWMINRSGGGDFVVIRATGTNAYNSYIYGLGGANSVETFLINTVAQANDATLVQTIMKAEAVFFAGGNQNDYISNYKGTALGTALDYLANTKHTPIGGTSAGMAIQGYIYYDGITNVNSSDVLPNPYASGTGIHYNDFLHNPFLQNTICDTHFVT
jgi:cyanophycinase-like exopeptidase